MALEQSNRAYFDDCAEPRELYSAAYTLAEAINARRVEEIEARLHPEIQLDVLTSEQRLYGRGVVVRHLRRLFRSLRRMDPISFAAAAAVLPFGGHEHHPCALVYEGPQRSCALIPGVDDEPSHEILTLTLVTEPSRLAAADRLCAPDFPGGVIAPRPFLD